MTIREYVSTIKYPLYGTQYVQTMEYDEEYGLTVTTWAIRYRKKDKEPQYKFAYEESEQRKLISSDMYFTGCGGWNMLWEKKRYGYYGTSAPTDERCETEKIPQISSAITLWTLKDLQSYLGIFKKFEEVPTNNIVKFYKMLQEYPQVEQVWKNDKLRYLWKDKRIYTYKKPKKLLSYLKMGYSVENAMGLIKYGSEEKMESQRKINSVKRKLKGLKISDDIAKEIPSYLNKQHNNIQNYYDYLKLCKHFNRDILDRGVLFPRNFNEQHDNLVILKHEEDERLENEKNKRKAKGYKGNKVMLEIAKKLNSLVDKVNNANDLKIIVPDSKMFLLDVTNTLHNCVGVSGYAEKMVEGKCLILIVYDNDKMLECCELTGDKRLSINQLYGDHNQKSEKHDLAKQVVNNFIKEFHKGGYSLQQ